MPTSPRPSSRYCLWLLAASAAFAVGCQGKGDLSGKVVYKEKPLVFGTVLAVSSDGAVHQSPIQADGSYALQGLPTGEVRFAVNSPNPKNVGSELIKVEGTHYPTFEHIKGWFPIPGKFSKHETAELSTTLKSGQNNFDIELK